MIPAPALLLVFLQPAGLDSGVAAYQDGDYAAACEQLRGLDPRTLRAADRARRGKYLGACNHVQGDLTAAREAFEAMLEADLDASLDPVLFPPEMITFLEEVRERRAAAQPAPPPPPPPPRETPPPGPEVHEARPPPPGKSRFRAALPFGAGQFQNGHDGKGTMLAVAQGVTLAAGAVGLALFESAKESGPLLGGGDFKDTGEAETLQAVYVGGFSLFAALWGYGVIDAFMYFDEPAPVAVLPAPGGLEVVGRW